MPFSQKCAVMSFRFTFQILVIDFVLSNYNGKTYLILILIIL